MKSLGHYRFREVTHYEIPIIHALMIHPDAEIENITTIMGHDQALRQCEQNLMSLFPNIEKMAGTGDLTDNASIAEAVAHGTLPLTTASIGHASLADIYGLQIIENNIQDRDDNRTTFVLVSL
jgi:prephenate dehydratase